MVCKVFLFFYRKKYYIYEQKILLNDRHENRPIIFTNKMWVNTHHCCTMPDRIHIDR